MLPGTLVPGELALYTSPRPEGARQLPGTLVPGSHSLKKFSSRPEVARTVNDAS